MSKLASLILCAGEARPTARVDKHGAKTDIPSGTVDFGVSQNLALAVIQVCTIGRTPRRAPGWNNDSYCAGESGQEPRIHLGATNGKPWTFRVYAGMR